MQRAAASRQSREGTFRTVPEPATQGAQPEVPTALEGRFVFDNSAFVQSETFLFLRTEAKDRGEAGSGFTLPRSNVTLSLVLNFCSSPSLRLRFSRGGRLGFQIQLELRMRMLVG